MTSALEPGIVPIWTVADRLRKSREFAGLDQGSLAEAIEVSRNTISNYESGRVTPRRIVLRQWSLRTGVPLEWIETGNAERHRPDGPDDGDECAARDLNPQPAD
ncbi:helix-turn-helix transcriptional regulator [Jatrophihabitans sp. DSM 45814]